MQNMTQKINRIRNKYILKNAFIVNKGIFLFFNKNYFNISLQIKIFYK